MIVHRFMCNLEYQRLMKGKLMKNTVVHAQLGSKSESVGFCFFTEAPEVAIHWLSFNVTTDWCVTFDIPDQLLTKSRAHYRDPEHDSFEHPASIWRTEWCLQEYSLRTVRVIEATDKYANYAENMVNQIIKEVPGIGLLLLAAMSQK